MDSIHRPRVIFSMTASLDGFVMDRDGAIDWTAPSDDLFRFHLDGVRELGGHLLGRRLHEGMRVWETDPAIRSTPDRQAFAEVWAALPKVVFSRTLENVEGNARLATRSLAEEIDALVEGTGGPVAIGGADLAGRAFAAGLVDELRLFRAPVLLGGGTPYLPPVAEHVQLERVGTTGFDNGVVLERYRTIG